MLKSETFIGFSKNVNAVILSEKNSSAYLNIRVVDPESFLWLLVEKYLNWD